MKRLLNNIEVKNIIEQTIRFNNEYKIYIEIFYYTENNDIKVDLNVILVFPHADIYYGIYKDIDENKIADLKKEASKIIKYLHQYFNNIDENVKIV